MNLPFACVAFRFPFFRSLAAAALAGMMMLPYPASGQATLLHTVPAPNSAQVASSFGRRVVSDGTFTVVGAANDDSGAAGSGMVKVYDSLAGGLLHVLVNPNPSITGQFGTGVAISGSRLVVGAPGDDTGATDAGRVYVYDLSSGTPTVPIFTLNNPSPAIGDRFGGAVAVDGTRVVVGVTRDDTGATDTGIAYVYDLSGGTPTVPAFTLLNPSPGSGDLFGNEVGIVGTRVVVAALFDDTGTTDAGSVYVFDVSGGTTVVFTLNNPTPSANDNFGSGLGISGTRVVVGAPFDDAGASNAGVAHVYDLSGGTPTVPAFTLTNPSAQAVDTYMGLGVAISGTRVVVGAYLDDTGASGAGIAYVFDLGSGTPTTAAATLSNPEPNGDDRFGISVAITGTRAAVGALNDDGGRGSVFLFDLSGGPPATPTAKVPGRKDEFGSAVALDGDTMVVGAPKAEAGTVHVYDLSGGIPTQPAVTLNNPDPHVFDYFGFSVAVSGSLVVVGDPYDDTGANEAGRAYVYDVSSGTSTPPIAVLNNPTPAMLDQFGRSVAISGTRVAVGVPDDDAGGNGNGIVYIYDMNSGTPTVPVTTLNNPNPAAGDQFGWSVAMDGTRLVVGTPLDDTTGSDAGSAYVYDLNSGTPAVPVATLTNPDPVHAVQPAFGISVGISGTRVVVGASNGISGAADAGTAYVYDVSSGTPTVPVVTLNNPAPEANDQFSFSVGISGTQVVVGTPNDNTGGTLAGRAYAFDLSSATPTVPVATIANPTSEAFDSFGTAVAIDGGKIAIGTPYDDATGSDRGGAHVFTLPGAPALDAIIATDGTATGAGLPGGTTFLSFTAPEIGVSGGKVMTPDGQKLDAVFTEDGTVLLRGQQSVVVEPGGSTMGMIAKLNPPTGNAVLATLDRRSGATAVNDQVLFLGLQDSDPEAMVRKGQEVPGEPGVTLKSFLTLDGNGDTTFFSGKLAGAGVNGGNNTAIFAASPATGFKMLVRKGQMVGLKKIKTIATLVGTAGTLAEGRWRAGTDSMGMRLTFTDKSQALYLVRATDNGPADWLRLGETGDGAGTDVPGALLKSFMLPAHAPGATVFDSLLQTGPGSITRKNNRAVFDAQGVDTRGPISLRLLAQVAGPAPALSNMQRFLNTLAGLGRASTLVANATLPGDKASRGTIFDARQDGVLVPIARLGGDAPGGGKYARFVSVAKPDGQGYGALVSALLKVDGRAGVTPKNRAALYARNSSGTMQRLLRAGERIESAGPGSTLKEVKSFVALSAAPGSIGAARGYDDTGKVNVLVTFPDRTQAVVSIQVP